VGKRVLCGAGGAVAGAATDCRGVLALGLGDCVLCQAGGCRRGAGWVCGGDGGGERGRCGSLDGIEGCLVREEGCGRSSGGGFRGVWW